MRKFSLKKLPLVTHDLARAGAWYELQNPGIGLADRLDAEVEAATEALRTDALFHRIRFGDVRRAPLKRFGIYGVYYVVRDDIVIVIAVFHDRRDRRRLRARRRNVDAQL